MEREEILSKTQQKRVFVGEMEKNKIDKSMKIALLVAGILAVALMIVEYALGHATAGFAIQSLCYGWASVFYFCQYFIAKRPWQVLFGAVLHGLAAITMLVFFILRCVGVL